MCGGRGRKGGEGGGGSNPECGFGASVPSRIVIGPPWRESRLVMWATIGRVVSYVVIPRPGSWRLWGGGRSPGGEWKLKKLLAVVSEWMSSKQITIFSQQVLHFEGGLQLAPPQLFFACF